MKLFLTRAMHRERASELLRRYARVSEEKPGEILRFIRTGRHLDIGLLSSDDGLRPKLESFMKDHKTDLRVNWRESAAVVGGILVLLITAWLIWASLADAASALAKTA
jgi:hypothetical protein